MCENSERRLPVGLIGLTTVILLVVTALLFRRDPVDEMPSGDARSFSTNVLESVAPAQTNILVSSCETNGEIVLKADPPKQDVRPVPASTNIVTAPAPVRRIENDPKVPKNRQVLLAHRRIVIESGRKFPSGFCTTQMTTERKTAPYILLSELPADRRLQSQAMANGVRVSGFLPNNALLVEADAEALKNLSEDPAFIAAVEYEPIDKVQPQLLATTDETFAATVLLMNAAYADAICREIEADGGKALSATRGKKKVVHATLTRKLVLKLAAKGEIRWIERRP